MVAKKAFVKRFASVRFDGVLASSERDDATRALASAGATVTSWNVCGERTYATVSVSTEPAKASRSADIATAMLAIRVPGSMVSPPLLILRITPDAARALPVLERALGGVGRPAGIIDACCVDGALVIECDTRRTSLATLVALVDTELATAPGRTIEPLVGLDDETLVAFARTALCEPELDTERLIETHLVRVLSSAAR